MWLFCQEGFFSVVADRNHEDTVLVRARSEQDLRNLQKRIERDCEIWEDPLADYRWRMRIAQNDFSVLLGEIALGIDYDNFKNNIAESNPRRAATYGGVWERLLEIEGERSSQPGEGQ